MNLDGENIARYEHIHFSWYQQPKELSKLLRKRKHHYFYRLPAGIDESHNHSPLALRRGLSVAF
jgi:hypothetical protein